MNHTPRPSPLGGFRHLPQVRRQRLIPKVYGFWAVATVAAFTLTQPVHGTPWRLVALVDVLLVFVAVFSAVAHGRYAPDEDYRVTRTMLATNLRGVAAACGTTLGSEPWGHWADPDALRRLVGASDVATEHVQALLRNSRVVSRSPSPLGGALLEGALFVIGTAAGAVVQAVVDPNAEQTCRPIWVTGWRVGLGRGGWVAIAGATVLVVLAVASWSVERLRDRRIAAVAGQTPRAIVDWYLQTSAMEQRPVGRREMVAKLAADLRAAAGLLTMTQTEERAYRHVATGEADPPGHDITAFTELRLMGVQFAIGLYAGVALPHVFGTC